MVNHQPPSLPYSGLTIILSNPSRFDCDNGKLLTATGGSYFKNECLYPNGINIFQCDVRTFDCNNSYLPDTHCILALGEKAQQQIGGVETTLGEQRGSPIFNSSGPTIISSYLPQDTQDMKDHEGEFNPLLNGSSYEGDEDGDEKSRHGKTSRKNWAFWLKKDVEKACILVKNKGSLPKDYDRTETTYEIYPTAQEVIGALLSVKNNLLFFDIETDPALNITCFAFAFNLQTCYVVPLLRFDYTLAYSPLFTCKILQALALSIRNNTLAAHNGAGFDYFVLAHKYRIPIGRKVYDTMLAQNRIYPEAEKSLGHSISLPWMWEPYHKDEGNFAYRNRDQELQLWKYCGKDVSSLVRLHLAQTNYSNSDRGLKDSIQEVNSYVRPYLICMLQGIRYDETIRTSIMDENDRLMNQYLRMLEVCIGKQNLEKIRGSGKSGMPGSSKQCCRYFHDILNYPVQGRSKETNQASLDAKSFYKLTLALKQLGIYNPVIDIVLAYRTLAKESGSLKFKPWKE